jgi:hypothetical protein
MANPSPTPEQKDEIIEYALEHSIEEANQKYGYSAKSIARWVQVSQMHSLTHARGDYDPEQWKQQMEELLKSIAIIAATRELELAPRSEIGFVNKVRTTAIHDLQLIQGKATERTESTAMTESEAVELATRLAKMREGRDNG